METKNIAEKETTEKNTRGGTRAGAGRKKKENGRNIPVAFTLSTKSHETLMMLVEKEGSNRNDAINKLLESLS